ncbi:hypothetical protein [Solitalea lacus]|uniref:hypothetical protein n=1 Tax=Solitalea lacus TaxID=2911172 RepID=UPI001EDB03DC|nr:hypothetical protein [Solitalea lacus]UKJ07791.1 hypothetical protein L2B55_01175 [Solitalea lacus]
MQTHKFTLASLNADQIANLKDGKLNICEVLKQTLPTRRLRRSATSFFSKDGNEGYITKEDFVEYIHKIPSKDRENFGLLLEYMGETIKMNSLPIVRLDKNGTPYIWCKFIMAQSVQEFKLIVTADLDKFIKHYQQGIFYPGFTLNELYLEALEA